MDDRDREQLGYLIDHANAAIGYAHAHGRDWWKRNETLDAVLMRISQVGETAKKVSPVGLVAVSGILWKDVKGIREIIVHHYQIIDVVMIRGVINRDLPALITEVRRALAVDDRRRKAAAKAAAQKLATKRPMKR